MSFLTHPHDGPTHDTAGHYPPHFPVPGPLPPPEVHVRPPLVYMPAAWEYLHRAYPLAEAGAAATLAELETLGGQGWELAGVAGDGQSVHFYFKREPR